jgi:CheY-like chemotaxis protein
MVYRSHGSGCSGGCPWEGSILATILVVDDYAEVRTVLGLTLQRRGWEIVPAGGGEEAVQRAQELVPDLVVMDVFMPGMSGLEVCRKLRQHKATQSVPIILITAHGDRVSVDIAREAGATALVTKPFSPRDLIAQVDCLLQQEGGPGNGRESGAS